MHEKRLPYPYGNPGKRTYMMLLSLLICYDQLLVVRGSPRQLCRQVS